MTTARPIPLLWPFILGFFLLVFVLCIVAFGDDPSPLQFTIYRIVIAIAGAGFAVALTGTLEVQFPILGNGYIRATAALGVLVILYFFSPATLAVDGGAVETKRLTDSYYYENSEVVAARKLLGANWELEKYGEILAEKGKKPNQENLESVRKMIRKFFEGEGRASAFTTVTSFHDRIFDCVNKGSCDTNISCREFFKEIEGFRNLFCDRIIEVSDRFSLDLWDRYRDFSENTCKDEFLAFYVQYDNVADLSEVCLPIQCWARNTKPPYPCQIRQQLVGGVMAPN